MPALDLATIATWAGNVGFDALEVAAWPGPGGPGGGPCHLDVTTLDEGDAERVRGLFEQNHLTISAIGYYENNLLADPARRLAIHDHLRRCIDAAVLLGCPLVGTFIGRDVGHTVKENLRMAESILPPLVEYATEREVRLIVENCPMEGWHPDGYPGNLAYSPELWEWMFSLGFYLNFDPSHLWWLGIDPVAAVRPYVDHVLHAQAKDTQVDRAARNRYGYYGRAVERRDPWDVGWWRYRVPGRGQIDWRAVIDALDEGGFDGTLSVEHEDPVWGGTVERVQRGLEIAYGTLRPLVGPGTSGEMITRPKEGSHAGSTDV
jgi:sugar phosphate isomerase/epimerase